jgi:hypothetical protein
VFLKKALVPFGVTNKDTTTWELPNALQQFGQDGDGACVDAVECRCLHGLIALDGICDLHVK